MRDLDADALEAAARAIWSVSFENARDDNAWEAIAEDTRAGVREEARRAIAAYLAAREAKGWREMPREPTPGMREAAAPRPHHWPAKGASRDYDAMVMADQAEARSKWLRMFDAAGGGDG